MHLRQGSSVQVPGYVIYAISGCLLIMVCGMYVERPAGLAKESAQCFEKLGASEVAAMQCQLTASCNIYNRNFVN